MELYRVYMDGFVFGSVGVKNHIDENSGKRVCSVYYKYGSQCDGNAYFSSGGSGGFGVKKKIFTKNLSFGSYLHAKMLALDIVIAQGVWHSEVDGVSIVETASLTDENLNKFYKL